ncbi:MAG: hypothetical protein ACI9QN_001205 [Arcticibacterium sp.]|jgi:hypothetical protein
MPEAEITYAMVIEYLEENWTIKEINNFLDRTDEVVNFIAQNPKQYLYSKKKDVYRAVVTKQISLYYRVNLNAIELLIFWDTRQNPNKLKI